MIIACPACATRYVVPDSAIGVEGRTVRCAKCKHSWYQDGPELPDRPAPTAEPAPTPEPVTPPPEPAPTPEPAPIEDRAPPPPAPKPAPAAVPRATATAAPAVAPTTATPNVTYRDAPPTATEPQPVPEPVEAAPELVENVPETIVPARRHWDDDPIDDDQISHFDRSPPFRPRRNWLKVWSWAAGLFAIVAFGTIFAASYYGLPDWIPVSRPTFAQAQTDLVLEFPPDEQDRRTLPNGSEYFGVSGSVTNTGSEARRMPPLLIVLRDERERNVYEWEIAPPKSTLAPGETVAIREAVTDVPKGARSAEFGWKPE
ncbi:MJ0042-type zinc finger domain-containing protein [Altererythrobacter sp. CAU 1778]